MAFDDKTRNRLNSFVTQARELLTKEFTQQCQVDFGLNPKTGEIKDLASLRFDDEKRQTAIILRETIAHYYANLPTKSKKTETDNKVLIARVIREQAFTILNRLCAVRMAEARDLIIQSVAEGVQSKGFQLYQHVVGPSLGDTGAAYEQYLFSLFDEFAIDLAVLFDRFSPQGRLFPRDTVLMELLGLINNPEINHLWAEDETIGWIYQYFNSKEERKAMRDASQAPRNSRELAVRNQFFTPRYVVEFLTDNTLGRIWYEMRQGNMPWVDDCKYLVRRPDEVFLAESTSTEAEFVQDGVVAVAMQLQSGTEVDFPEFSAGTDDEVSRMIDLAHTVSAYTTLGDQAHELLSDSPSRLQEDRALKLEEGFLDSPTDAALAVKSGEFTRTTTQQILNTLFMTCRSDRHGGDGSVYKERWFVDACNEVRRRILHSCENDLPHEEMLRAPVLIPCRPLKDPRDIRMLDPACGSMHFGLYAFDLYLKIYDEYWDLCHDSGFRAPATEHRLPTEEYADKAAWMKAAPKLIIEHNIHGIDIDPRAVQIAGLSLWLRAQRAWKAQGLAAGDRPQVTRSNVVCAEPMPGDQQQLAEFCKSLHPAIAQMVTAIFGEMKLAGEAGSLLKIEQEITGLVAAAKKQWEKEPKAKQLELFGSSALVKEQQLEFDLSGITDEEFFEKAEETIYEALRKYASETSEGGFRRKLFAGDAEKGFAFIELLSKSFDVSLMNPPFGAEVASVTEIITTKYSGHQNDIYSCFVARCEGLVPRGFVGAITSRSCLIRKRLKVLRENHLIPKCQVLVDLGAEVMDDATVESCAYVLSSRTCSSPFLAFDARENRADFSDARLDNIPSFPKCRLGFLQLPAFRILYSLPERLFQVLSTDQHFEPTAGTAREGMKTFGNDRFLRLWWEVPVEAIGRDAIWEPYVKGGQADYYFADVRLLLKWNRNGAELCAVNYAKNGSTSQVRQASDYWRRAGCTYSRRQKIFAVRYMPRGCIFSDKGPAILPNEEEDAFVLAAWFNSNVIQAIVHLQANASDVMTGILKRLPWATLSTETKDELRAIGKRLVNARFRMTNWVETSNTFCLSPFSDSTYSSSADTEHFSELFAQLQPRVDKLIANTFDLDGLDWIGDVSEDDDEDDASEDDDVELAHSDRDEISDCVSFAFGASIGRWAASNLHFTQTDMDEPEIQSVPNGQLLSTAHQTKILVDDVGHKNDVISSMLATVDGIASEHSESVCNVISAEGFRNRMPVDFFAEHLARYTSFRRQAPIYWPISTESGSYTLWFYYHRLTDQTLYKAVNDFVDPKLRDDIRPSLKDLRAIKDRSSIQEKELGKLTELESELEQFKADLLEIAAFWKPNLNDGVQITAAPLWKFFRHTAWRNKLKKTWEELQEGTYDWAHLALSIWPERVVKEKCTTDRSIAIAHDLVEQLWHEVEVKKTSKTGRVTSKTEWQPRNLSDAELDAIVQKIKMGGTHG